MFAFNNILSQAAQLLHSPNLSELMGGDEQVDLVTMLTESGIDPGDLCGLSVEAATERLVEAGVDLSAIDGQALIEGFQSLRGR